VSPTNKKGEKRLRQLQLRREKQNRLIGIIKGIKKQIKD